MAEEKRPNNFGNVGVITPLHEIAQRALREFIKRPGDDGREGEKRRAGKIARHEKPPWQKAGQGNIVRAAFGEIGGEMFGRLHSAKLVGPAACIKYGEM